MAYFEVGAEYEDRGYGAPYHVYKVGSIDGQGFVRSSNGVTFAITGASEFEKRFVRINDDVSNEPEDWS